MLRGSRRRRCHQGLYPRNWAVAANCITIRFVAALHLGAARRSALKTAHHAHSSDIYCGFEVETQLPEPTEWSAFSITEAAEGCGLIVQIKQLMR